VKNFIISFWLCAFCICNSYAQDSIVRVKAIEDTVNMTYSLQGELRCLIAPNKKRKYIVGGTSAALYGGSLISLNKAWYQNYPKAPFHTFDDSKEWLQVDKVGHAWTAYQTSRGTTAAWTWAGLPHKKAVLLGSATGFTYLTVIEILDAHSAEWGWSWADMGANLFGSALYAGQELHWKAQKIQFKFSAHHNNYEPLLQHRADKLYGNTLPQRLLKDYNGQTYWLSFNVKGILKVSQFPEWLNVAIGYGADGLWGGFENKGYDSEGNVIFNRTDISRHRQWYLSPDIDFTKIKTGSKPLKTLLFLLNAIKIPAPALEFSNGRFKGHIIQF
jgi:hypothetical protein